jgi:alkylation response protein AidB-like acyl-CoA dehydrogenase
MRLMATKNPAKEHESFAEAALRLGGKSELEARATGAIDRADEQVEALFAQRYQTANSPVHKVVWDRRPSLEMFRPTPAVVTPECEKAMSESLELVRRRRAAGTLLDDECKISDAVLMELAAAGYWGLLVDRQYGGLEAPFARFARFLIQMASVNPTVAGLASVHGCIGAVDPLRTFGTPEQKERFLPKLARGERLSGFALTEPCAGSDLTALRTRATLDGDHYVVHGEKLFITNAVCGRTIGLVCLVDNKPAVLIVDLPERETDEFQLVRYGLYALKHTHNNGLRFTGLRVPKENLLQPKHGDGLTIAYHGLNLGRVSLCATAAGNMRVMLASLIPWARFRRTYGEAIARRELVRRRIGRLAGMIVAADALVDWCAWLLDQGFRGEMECTIAKIFGSEAQKEAAIEQCMKTHGGRAFLRGHFFGDNVHEFLAPCIYEGEGEMLAMAFFKSLIKEHGRTYFEPVGRAMQSAGITRPNFLNPFHLWKLRPALPYLAWRIGERFLGHRPPTLPELPPELAEHAQFAVDALQRMPRELSGVMLRHAMKLPDRQCRIAELSARVQHLVVMLIVSLNAGTSTDEVVRCAADCLCDEITQQFLGQRPSDEYFRKVTRLGETIVDGGFAALAGIESETILMPYPQEPAT